MTVEEVVGKVFQIEPQELSDLSSRETIEQWDSMGHLTLISEIEAQFQINISIADTIEMVSVRRIKETLKHYGVKA